MSKNDDALNCADAMELVHGAGHADAVRHIRRLVAENEAQAALVQQALAAMKPVKLVSGDPNPLAEAIAAIEQWQKGKA